MIPKLFVLMEQNVLFIAFSANGKDVIVDFPQQSHWTGLLSEMELVPSVHPGVRYGCVKKFFSTHSQYLCTPACCLNANLVLSAGVMAVRCSQ